MLEPELEPAFKAWKASPGPEANVEMLKTLHPVIEGAVRTHLGQSDPLAMGHARRLTLGGLRSYDPAKGKLKTHLYNHLQGLKRFNRKQLQPVHVPERMGLERQGLAETEQTLSHDLGRDPSDAELTDHLGISQRRLSRLRGLNSGIAEGTMDAAGDGAFQGGTRGLAPERDMWSEIVYGDSPPLDQKIMEYNGHNGHPVLPNHMIAKKLGLSPGAISQRKQKIQQRLDQRDDLSPF